MIDKNGKLFGKINIIDLLIIVVIIAALIILGVRKLNSGNGAAAGGGQTVRITFFGDYVNDFLPDSLTVGDPCSDYSSDVDLGVLTSFEVEPAYTIEYDEKTGEAVTVPVLNHVWLTFTCETTGSMGPTGFTKEDARFVVGGNYAVNIGPSRTMCQLQSFEVVG